MLSLYVRCESRMTPKSFALKTGVISLPKNERVIDEGNFFNRGGGGGCANYKKLGFLWVDQ